MGDSGGSILGSNGLLGWPFMPDLLFNIPRVRGGPCRKGFLGRFVCMALVLLTVVLKMLVMFGHFRIFDICLIYVIYIYISIYVMCSMYISKNIFYVYEYIL